MGDMNKTFSFTVELNRWDFVEGLIECGMDKKDAEKEVSGWTDEFIETAMKLLKKSVIEYITEDEMRDMIAILCSDILFNND